MGNLGLGVGTPGDGQGAGLGPAKEQGVLNDNPGQGVGGVGELIARANVAGGIDPPVARLQPIIDVDAATVVVRNAHPLQVQPLDVRLPADRQQDLVGHDLGRRCITQAQHLPLQPALDSGERGLEKQLHAVAPKGVFDPATGIGVLPGQDLLVGMQQRDPRPQPGERLGQLAADGAAANHRQTWRQRGQRKDRLVGQEARLRQAGNVRQPCPAARGDHRLAKAQALAGHLHRVGSAKASLTQKHVHTQTAKAAGRVVGT